MTYFIGVIEDQAVLRREIVSAVKHIPASSVREDARPWRFLESLKDVPDNDRNEGGIVVADLYVRGYWAESPKAPKGLRERPSFTSSSDPSTLTSAVVDCIRNYLEPLVNTFHFDLVVYTYMLTFLKTNPAWASHLSSITSELAQLAVGEDRILHKSHIDDYRTQEIAALAERVQSIVEQRRREHDSDAQ